MKRYFAVVLSFLLLINIFAGCGIAVFGENGENEENGENSDDEKELVITGQDASVPERLSEKADRQELMKKAGELTSAEIEAWALGCSAVLAISDRVHGTEPYKFGMSNKDAESVAMVRRMLSASWGCENRNDLIETIDRMTDNGHSAGFAEEYIFISTLSESEYNRLLAEVDRVGAYMVPYILELGEKWGDKEIKAWDWFRMIHLAGWGYIAGFIELDEAYSLMEPVINRLRNTFTSWDEAVENYLDGYAWWSQADVVNDLGEYRIRVTIYELFRNEKFLFNPTVWTSEFVQAPSSGFTYDDNGDGTCTVTGFFGEPYENLVIPDEINDLTVTAISVVFDFKDFTGFSGTLTLPAGLTFIDFYAFENGNFSGVIVIPEGVTEIKNSAFRECNILEQVDFLGDAPENFGSTVFHGCAEDFRITYDPTKSGWTTPEWNGYPCFPR